MTSVAYDSHSSILAIGGGGVAPSASAALLQAKRPPGELPLDLPSISLWLLNETPPHATLLFATTTAAVTRAIASPLAWWRSALASATGAGVPASLEFAPGGGARLAVLTLAGQLSVWGLAPLAGMRAGHSTGCPEPPLIHVADDEPWTTAHWWDGAGAGALVLAQRSGAVSVCALPHLRNLLGDKPEPFKPRPRLSLTRGAARARKFFLLECDAAAPTIETPAATPGGAAAVPVARRVQSWRLLSLQETSPEQLFHRKARALPPTPPPTRVPRRSGGAHARVEGGA